MWGQQGQGFGQGYGQGFNQQGSSQIIGGNGGGPGEFTGPNYSLIGVRGKAGDAVDRLQFLFVDISTGQCVESPILGGAGGAPFEFVAPAGQWIDKIRTKSGNYLLSLTFETNAGVSSPKIGNGAGKEDFINLSGKRITGVKWRSGSLVDNLQFHYST